MRISLVDRILYLAITFAISSTYLVNISPYGIPLLVFSAFTILLVVFMDYHSKTLYFAIMAAFLVLLWVLSLFKVVVTAYSWLYYLETVLISIIILFIGLNMIKSWEKRDNALKCYENILREKPNDTMALNNKGVELTRQSKYLMALECFDKVIELNSDDAAAWRNKGILIKKEDKKLSKKYLEKAQQLDPGLKKSIGGGKLILK